MRNSVVKYFLLFIVLVGVTIITIRYTGAETEEDIPGLMTITTNTTLTADHTGQIKLDADNITLDCANHKVLFSLDNTIGCGLTGTFRCGIRSENRSGITIKNCEVIGAYDFGVWVAGSRTPSLVENVTVRSSFVGFRIEKSDRMSVRNCTGTTSTDDGFDIRTSSNLSMIGDNAFSNTRGGIDVNDSDHVSIQQAQVHDNGDIGIEFDGGPFASLKDSVVRHNGHHGLSIDPSETAPGPCSAYSIINNIFENNTGEGMRIQNCDNGTFQNNTSQGNVGCNANQEGESSGSTWTGNNLQNWCGTVPKKH